MQGSGASSASDCVALQGRPVKGAPSGRVAEAMAQAPPLTVPPFQAVSGSTTPLQLTNQVASTSPARQLPKPDAVKAGLTPKRPRRQVENDEYSAFVRRILRAYARRVGDGDVEALALMHGLADEIDTAIAEAVKGLRTCGYSWIEIGDRLGITRQAAQQRWGAS
jgi:hypothetical protein